MLLNQIKNKILSISPIAGDTWSELEKLFVIENHKPNEKLLDFDQKAKFIYFLHSGLIRSYTLTENGSEFSKTIYGEQNFFAPVTSLVTQLPSKLCYETLTESVISKAKYTELELLNSKFFDLEHFHRKQMEWLYVYYEKSVIEMATLDATKRYMNLRSRFPNIDNLIPQYKIASHLGITNVQLSRIRKEIR